MNVTKLRRDWSGLLLVFLAANGFAATSSDWPQWRGPERSGHAPAGAVVPDGLPDELRPVWQIEVGTGHSSPIVADGQLIYLDQQENQEVVHLVEAATGREQWRVPVGAVYGDEWGSGPRSTPFVDDDRVYAQSCRGEFVCLKLSDGAVVWRTSFERDFGVAFLGSRASRGTASRRGNNGSGVIEGDRLILPVGSQDGASLVAFDKRTGRVLWKSGNDEAAYSSLVIATLAGRKQVVAFTADALLGAALEDGQILWRVPLKTAAKRHACTPVIVGDTVTVASHSIGLVCVRVTEDSGGFKAAPAWTNTRLRINIGTPVVVGDCFYSQGPKGDFICVDCRTGELKWSQPGFGPGQKDYCSNIVLGDRLLVLTEGGLLLLLQANPERYTELDRLQVCGNTWSYPAYSQGKLFVRDSRHLVCVDLMAGN